MKIRLDANPDDAPGCVKIISTQSKRDYRKALGLGERDPIPDYPDSILVQGDYDLCGVARTFGWSPSSVQPHIGGVPCEISSDDELCPHRGTDGTIDCPECWATASDFIASAREWIDDHDGAEVEDPGYFN